jgi:hypothetical protein
MTGTPERAGSGAEPVGVTSDQPASRNRRQIEFPRLQTHSRAFEGTMVLLSILCVIIVLIIVLGTDMGTTTRP